MTLGVGEEFAGYVIERQLGSGGMGEVYLARHPRLPRSDALKILREDISADTAFRERFIREADSIAGLSHPNIVSVYDRGETRGLLWIATQFVDGTDAAKLLKARYPAGMPVDVAARIVSAVADALDYAHEEHGLLHRDVKPANILLAKPTSDGTQRIYLADFGIARPLEDPAGLTATNFTVGTVAYAAPEQLMGQQISGRADQYALAATAFHLLTGSSPYRDPNPITVISQHLTQPPPLLSTMRRDLAALDPVIQKAMAKDPQQRYPRCSDFARALREAHQQVVDPSAATQHATPAAQPPFPAAAHNSAQPVSGRRTRTVPLLAAVGVAFTAALVYAGTQLGKTSNTVESAPTANTTSMLTPTTPATAAPLPPLTPTPKSTVQPDDSSPPISNGAAYIITRSGKTACRLTGQSVDCYVQFNANADKEVINGKPMTGVSFMVDGSQRWLTDGRGDHDYTTLEYGAVYHALNWTIKSYDQGTIFINDVTGMGMMISAQGFTTIQPGSPTNLGDNPSEGMPCADKDRIVPSGNGELICNIVSTGPFVLQWKRFTQSGLETVTRGAVCAPTGAEGDFRFARSTDDYLVWCVRASYAPNATWVPYQP